MTTLGKMVWNFAIALKDHAANGFSMVSAATYTERVSICLKCDDLNKKTERCKLCGCHMPTKAGWKTSFCPANPRKWNRINDDTEGTKGNNTTPGN